MLCETRRTTRRGETSRRRNRVPLLLALMRAGRTRESRRSSRSSLAVLTARRSTPRKFGSSYLAAVPRSARSYRDELPPKNDATSPAPVPAGWCTGTAGEITHWRRSASRRPSPCMAASSRADMTAASTVRSRRCGLVEANSTAAVHTSSGSSSPAGVAVEPGIRVRSCVTAKFACPLDTRRWCWMPRSSARASSVSDATPNSRRGPSWASPFKEPSHVTTWRSSNSAGKPSEKVLHTCSSLTTARTGGTGIRRPSRGRGRPRAPG